MSVSAVRLLNIKTALGFILYIACTQIVLGASAIDSQCLASSQYMSELKSLLIDPGQDFSCLTDIPTLGQKISTYQLVDIRGGKDLSPLKDAWTIPVAELKNKSFLMKRPLLLVGDGFSRVSAAHDCAVLKKAGFSSVKIVVGGVDTWSMSHGQSGTSSKSINGRQFLYEYFNGSLVVLAATPKVATDLATLGLTKNYVLEDASEQRVIDMVLSKSNNGYDPVVVISESSYKISQTTLSKFPNLYLIPGGIGALKEEIKQNLWSRFNQENINTGSFCAAK